MIKEILNKNKTKSAENKQVKNKKIQSKATKQHATTQLISYSEQLSIANAANRLF